MFKSKEIIAGMSLLTLLLVSNSALAERTNHLGVISGTAAAGFGVVSVTAGKPGGFGVGMTFILMGSYTMSANGAFAEGLSTEDAKNHLEKTIAGLKQYISAPDTTMNLEFSDLLAEFASNDGEQNTLANANELLRVLEKIQEKTQVGTDINEHALLSDNYTNDINQMTVSRAIFLSSKAYLK